MSDALELTGLTKAYGQGPTETRVLHGIDLRVPRGELLAIVGPSGSGKSTLLNLIGLLDRPSGGRLEVCGVDTGGLDEAGRTRLRGASLGFVFQFHHLLPALSAAENVAMPLATRRGRVTAGDLRRAREALARLDVGELADRRPTQISGGQRQRVAIARALVGEPALVLADEPTGNLDTVTGAGVFDEIRRLNRELAITFVVVTHDEAVARQCDRVVELVDGRVVRDERV
ncbi:MAG TPA: ABC transporter ATP-binding protein [Sandaracinaceae bacterium LLY-WYZ-13_1]|nr:ABC transporter ATP-binding protein [Sandaracinaceae bacterium LLY-WYZ-13_1]